MCFGSVQRAPDPTPVTTAPTREQIAAETAKQEAEAANETIRTVQESKAKLATRQGVYGNIKTSRSGDSNYGTNVSLARFGVKSKLGSAA